MKVFVINMLKDTEKKNVIKCNLDKIGISKVEFFEAVEGRRLTEEQLNSLADMEAFQSRYGRFATLPALGCALSHIGVYEKIIKDESIKVALILEDDAIPSPYINSGLEHWLSFIEDISCPTAILLTPDFVYHKSGGIVEEHCNHRLYRVNSGYMTSGYLINREGAELLYKKLRPVSRLADEWGYFQSLGLVLYGLVPHVISYPDGLGEIGRSQHIQQRNIFQKIRYRLAGIKGRLSKLKLYKNGYRFSKKLW